MNVPLVYIDALMSTYAPATSPEEATHWFSTDEVYDAIRRLDPSTEISKSDVFEGLQSAGFRFQPRPGTQGIDFKWMLKLK